MTMMRGSMVCVGGVLATLALGGCSAPPAPATSGSAPAGMANPASEYCIQKGGKLEIVRGKDGEQGLCHLPDGSVVEEWTLYRRDHSRPGASASGA